MKKVSNYFSTVQNIAEHFKIPFEYFLDLIAGVRMDLHHFRYNSFEHLKLYCYRVASTVGLMSIQIFGYRDPIIRQYAENLGIALQLTNIIRDVGTDARMGRIYLPQEDLDKFGVSTNDINHRNYTPAFRELMVYQANRAHHYYDLSEKHLPSAEKGNMLVGEIMKNIYLAMLQKIETRNYEVLNHTIRLSTPVKFYLTLKTVSAIKLQK